MDFGGLDADVLIMQVNLNDIYSIWYVIAVIAVGVLAVSLTKGYCIIKSNR